MPVHHLASVDGDLVLDLPGVTPAGGPVVVDDAVRLDDVTLLARSATYRAAAFEERIGGGAVGVRPRLIDGSEATVERTLDELASTEALGDFTPDPDDPSTRRASAHGVVAAIDAWLGGLEGRTIAVAGCDEAGLAVAELAVARGARLVGVSSVHGAIADAAGLDPAALRRLVDEHGTLFVAHLDGTELHRADELPELIVDVLAVAGPTGTVDRSLAQRVGAGAVVPLTDVAYQEAALLELRSRRVAALPDFVTTAGAFLAAHAPRGLSPDEVVGRVERMIHERITAARLAKVDPIRYAATLADTFLATWVDADTRPDGPAMVRPVSL